MLIKKRNVSLKLPNRLSRENVLYLAIKVNFQSVLHIYMFCCHAKST